MRKMTARALAAPGCNLGSGPAERKGCRPARHALALGSSPGERCRDATTPDRRRRQLHARHAPRRRRAARAGGVRGLRLRGAARGGSRLLGGRERRRRLPLRRARPAASCRAGRAHDELRGRLPQRRARRNAARRRTTADAGGSARAVLDRSGGRGGGRDPRRDAAPVARALRRTARRRAGIRARVRRGRARAPPPARSGAARRAGARRLPEGRSRRGRRARSSPLAPVVHRPAHRRPSRMHGALRGGGDARARLPRTRSRSHRRRRCFLAGFAVGLLRGWPARRAALLANWCGARAVESPGLPTFAALPDLE